MERRNNRKKVTWMDQKFHYRMEFVEYDIPQAHRSVGINTVCYTQKIKEIYTSF